MAELLPESWLAAESSDAEVSGHAKVVSIFPKRRRAPVTDVLVWVQCFSAMVGVLSTKYPDKVPEFMAYQALIVKCSRDYEGFVWVLYDRAFRRQVAVTRDLNWSKLNPTLHSLCMAGKARKNKFCALCLSDNHSSDQCPEAWQDLLPATYFGQHGPPPACPFPQPGLIPRLAGFGHPILLSHLDLHLYQCVGSLTSQRAQDAHSICARMCMHVLYARGSMQGQSAGLEVGCQKAQVANP